MTTDTKLIRTVFPAHCGIDACGILAHVKKDRVVKVEPAEFPDPKYRRICLRGLSSLGITYHPDRLKYPMKREGQAMHFGDLNDPDSNVSKLVKSRNALQLKPDENTGPCVYYCPLGTPRGL